MSATPVYPRNASAADRAEWLAGRSEQDEQASTLQVRRCDCCGGREVWDGDRWKHSYSPSPCTVKEASK